MTPDKPKAANMKSQPAAAKPAPDKSATLVVPVPTKPPRLFRAVDWLAFGVVTVLLV